MSVHSSIERRDTIRAWQALYRLENSLRLRGRRRFSHNAVVQNVRRLEEQKGVKHPTIKDASVSELVSKKCGQYPFFYVGQVLTESCALKGEPFAEICSCFFSAICCYSVSYFSDRVRSSIYSLRNFVY